MNASELNSRLEQYLEVRRALGFELQAEARLLHRFVDWLHARGPLVAITAAHAVEWACSGAPSSPGGASARRLSAIRGFLIYLQAAVPDTAIPERGLLRTPARPKPYIYDSVEIEALMAEASALGPPKALRPHTYHTLIGLLASCGLRVGEAIKLRLADVELELEPPRLRIEQSKFGKSRVVPVHRSTAAALNRYAERRAKLGYDGYCDRFFISEAPGPLHRSSVGRTFLALARRTQLRGPPGEAGPRLQDLRHRFMVERLRRWYQDGTDVRRRLPELSVFVGHSRPEHTYWYLTATPELLASAAERFEAYVAKGEAL